MCYGSKIEQMVIFYLYTFEYTYKYGVSIYHLFFVNGPFVTNKNEMFLPLWYEQTHQKHY